MNEVLVLKSARALDERVERGLARGLARGLQYASGIAQREFLSGPRPAKLGVRTGRLRNSISTEVIAGKQTLRGRIGSNVSYAAIHEFGFHGTVNVQAHQRVNRVFNQRTGKNVEPRRAIFDLQGNLLGYKESRVRALARAGNQKLGFNAVMVRAHKRRVDYNGRPYIAPALAKTDFAAEIKTELDGLRP